MDIGVPGEPTGCLMKPLRRCRGMHGLLNDHLAVVGYSIASRGLVRDIRLLSQSSQPRGGYSLYINLRQSFDVYSLI